MPRRDLRVRPRSRLVRSTAGVGIVLMLSTLWRPSAASVAASEPRANDRPAAPSPAHVPTRLAPLAAEWRRPDGPRPAAALFDGDQATALRTDGEATIRITLAQAAPVLGV